MCFTKSIVLQTGFEQVFEEVFREQSILFVVLSNTGIEIGSSLLSFVLSKSFWGKIIYYFLI